MGAQYLRGFTLFRGDLGQHVIDDATRPQSVSIHRYQRRTSIETNMGGVSLQRALPDALVLHCIRNHEHLFAADCLVAEGDISRGPRRRQAYFGLESLARAVDQADERDGCPGNRYREAGEPNRRSALPRCRESRRIQARQGAHPPPGWSIPSVLLCHFYNLLLKGNLL